MCRAKEGCINEADHNKSIFFWHNMLQNPLFLPAESILPVFTLHKKERVSPQPRRKKEEIY
jgi:hypothetical protein